MVFGAFGQRTQNNNGFITDFNGLIFIFEKLSKSRNNTLLNYISFLSITADDVIFQMSEKIRERYTVVFM